MYWLSRWHSIGKGGKVPELHIGPDGQLHSVLDAGETSSYAQELAQVQLRLATAEGEERDELLVQEKNLLLCMASLRWSRAMTQLQAEGVLSQGPWFRPVALGQPTYYADRTRDTYYKVWWQGERAVAVERLAYTFFATTLGVAWLSLQPEPGFYALPSPPMLRDPASKVHFRDYYHMALAVVEYPRLIFTFTGRSADDYLQTDSNAAGLFRYWGQGTSGPEHEAYVPTRAPRLPEFTQCRVCGCTNEDCRQCIEAIGQPCSWAAPYLCSRCYTEQKGGQNG